MGSLNVFLIHCWKCKLPSHFKTIVSVLFDTVCIEYHYVNSLLNTICYKKSFYFKQTKNNDNFLTMEKLNDYCRIVIFLVNWKYYGKVKYANFFVFSGLDRYSALHLLFAVFICYFIHIFFCYRNYFSSCLQALVGCILVLEVICSMYLRYASQCFIFGEFKAPRLLIITFIFHFCNS